MSSLNTSKLPIQKICIYVPGMAKSQPGAVEIGQRVKAIYVAHDWQAKDFAKMIGTTAQNLGNWVSGRHVIPHDYAIKAAKLGGTTILWVYQGEFVRTDPETIGKLTDAMDQTDKSRRRRARRA